MDRTQKKCFVAVAVMHALLVLIAVVGTAFFNKEEKIQESPHIIEIFNANVTDGPTRGGATAAIAAIQSAPEVKPAPPIAKPIPAPQPPPQPEPEPEPERERVVERPKPEPVEPKKEISELPVPTKVEKKTPPKTVSTPKTSPKTTAKTSPKTTRNIDISKPVVRNSHDTRAEAAAAAQAAQRNAQMQVAAAIKGAASRLGQNLSSSTTVNLQGGSGDGEGAVNYGDLVMKKYDDAWNAPNEVSDNEAIVKAKVVIARNGNVISADIIKASGNPVLDKSVQRALGLRSIHPFPEGSKDSQRTYIINFNLKTKRGLG